MFQTLLGSSAEGLFLEEHIEEWTENYAPLCPRIAGADRFPDAPYLVDHMLLTEREMDSDPVYDWYGKYDLRYFIGCKLFDSPDLRAVWSLQRTRSQGHAQQRDIRLFELLTPHIARSLSTALQLGTLRSRERMSSTILGALPQEVFVVARDAQVLFANERALQLLARRDGVAMDGGRLKASDPNEQARLDTLVKSALAPVGSGERGWMRVSRPSGGPPYAVFVAPLHIADEELSAPGAKALVLVHDTAHHRSVAPDMLISVYGLTETEARLASALSGGHSMESAASLLHMRPATARTHLKAVFRKMGVGRQQELVRVLASATVLLSAHG